MAPGRTMISSEVRCAIEVSSAKMCDLFPPRRATALLP